MDGTDAAAGGGEDAARASLWRLLFISMVHLLNAVEAGIKDDHDLTLLDMGLLFATRADEGRSMGSLAGLFGVDPSVMTYRVQRLQERGLVARRRAQHDGRVVEVVRTEQGVAALRRARRRMLASADAHLFSALSEPERAGLQTALESLLRHQLAGREDAAFGWLLQHP